MTKTLLTAHDLKKEVDISIQNIKDNFGEKAVKDFIHLARKAELNTDYECSDDIESLQELLIALVFFIDRENRIKPLRISE